MADQKVENNEKKTTNPPSPVIVTAGGYSPFRADYFMTASSLSNDILELARRHIPEFIECSLIRKFANGREPDDYKDYPVAYLWLKKNSKHILQDMSENNPDILPIKYNRPSQELMNFLKAYGVSEYTDKKGKFFLKDSEENPNVKAVLVDCRRVIDAIFDLYGNRYQKTYGIIPPDVHMPVTIKWNSNDIRQLDYIIVSKELKSMNRSKKLTPKLSPIGKI